MNMDEAFWLASPLSDTDGPRGRRHYTPHPEDGSGWSREKSEAHRRAVPFETGARVQSSEGGAARKIDNVSPVTTALGDAAPSVDPRCWDLIDRFETLGGLAQGHEAQQLPPGLNIHDPAHHAVILDFAREHKLRALVAMLDNP